MVLCHSTKLFFFLCCTLWMQSYVESVKIARASIYIGCIIVSIFLYDRIYYKNVDYLKAISYLITPFTSHHMKSVSLKYMLKMLLNFHASSLA